MRTAQWGALKPSLKKMNELFCDIDDFDYAKGGGVMRAFTDSHSFNIYKGYYSRATGGRWLLFPTADSLVRISRTMILNQTR